MSNPRPRPWVLSEIFAPTLLLLLWGCGGSSGSSQANLPLGVPPTSETSTAPSADPGDGIEDAVSGDLPSSSPPPDTETEIADEETASSEDSPSPPAEPSSRPVPTDTSTTAPAINSISAPSLVAAGEIVIVVAEVSTPAGLQSFQVALTGSGLTVEVPLPLADLGCIEGGTQCSVQGSLAVPEGITGTYRATLTVTDQLNHSASRSIEFEVF